ncbi:hypothetical protein D3H65_29575 [Paraflavitalea soli]|uniref:DUF5689 domain-containing protein n=1 Tax=Paraflavitalea soli TaxID=2315862 RepID=A0A3B7MVD6_9BACT|nr:DUF5689 domain-containing protein [Paraflavitalea soli]AXY77887.1 hypothetical protein D3H65_29575 [Paraflavitalea soli]
MKKIILYSFFLLSLASLWGCKKDNYPGGAINSFIGIYDLRNIYKGQDVTLTKENMLGSTSITGMVVSEHSGGNLPAGLLVIQDMRRLGLLRGIAIPIGAEAANYHPGDSVVANVEGALLKRVDGILQITNLPANAIKKVSSGNSYLALRVPISFMLANPADYESVLSVIVKGGFDPLPAAGDVLSGDKLLNDGFGNITLHTAANASFANLQAPVLANFYGIAFNTNGPEGTLVPRFHLRTDNDVVVLSSVIEIPPVIITGFMSDVAGGDGNYEYIQMMATKDINFATTPFSVVVTNNANASNPSGYPVNGWATGNQRTFKFNLTTGSAAKGSFFYVGGTTKRINGSGSTSMSTSNWIRTLDYVNNNGDGFGAKTGGLFANSGNASGLAVFEGTDLTGNSKPVDVIFVATGGSLYTAGPPAMGYRITNNDWYDVKNPITLQDQPFYRQGSNTLSLTYATADQGYFNLLGGEYNLSLGRWTKARTQTNYLLTKQSPVTEIEGEGATKLK